MSIIFKKKVFSLEELKLLVLSSLNKTELAQKLGYNYCNGVTNKRINSLLNDLGISTEHFDRFKKLRDRRKYELITKDCPICNKKFETQDGSPKEKTTCSYICSNTYFAKNKHTKKSKLKTSESLKKYYAENPAFHITTTCVMCNKIFPTTNWDIERNHVHCSKECLCKDPKYREKLSKSAKERVANGTHKGWASRSKLEPSYPEKYVAKLLEELNLGFIKELKVGRWFVDFAFPDKMIALEIDGKQHDLPERKASDIVKDEHLVSQGWTVHRIRWKKITKEIREELISKIKSLVNLDVQNGSGITPGV
jgi:very-short-patch-repair endonuclease